MEWNPAKQGTVVMGSIVWVWMGDSHLEPNYKEPKVPKATAERASQSGGWLTWEHYNLLISYHHVLWNAHFFYQVNCLLMASWEHCAYWLIAAGGAGRRMLGCHANMTPPKREADCTSHQEGSGGWMHAQGFVPKSKVVLLKMVQFSGVERKLLGRQVSTWGICQLAFTANYWLWLCLSLNVSGSFRNTLLFTILAVSHKGILSIWSCKGITSGKQLC